MGNHVGDRLDRVGIVRPANVDGQIPDLEGVADADHSLSLGRWAHLAVVLRVLVGRRGRIDVGSQVLDQGLVGRGMGVIDVFMGDEHGVTGGRVGGVHRYRDVPDRGRRVAVAEVRSR